MKKRMFSLLLAGILSVGVLAGCGNTEPSQEESVENTVTEEQLQEEETAAALPAGTKKAVPALMYHHFIEEGPAMVDTVVSMPVFEEQMKALADAGYTAIHAAQLIDYVENGVPLPEKPVLITIDDGYTSNLTLAAPVFEKYGMKATVFVIGINVGETLYAHSGEVLDPPRFGWEEAQPWLEKGVIDIQSHTYDMHQRESYGFSGREGVLSIPGESEAAYRQALAEDITKSAEGIRTGLGKETTALAFPFGFNSPIAVEELQKKGVKVTVTTERGCSTAVVGNENSIQCMKRLNVSEELSGKDLVKAIQKLEKSSTVNG